MTVITDESEWRPNYINKNYFQEDHPRQELQTNIQVHQSIPEPQNVLQPRDPTNDELLSMLQPVFHKIITFMYRF